MAETNCVDLVVAAGATNISVDIPLRWTADGLPATGLTHLSPGLAIAWRRGATGTMNTGTPLALTPTSGYTEFGFCEVQPVNMPGVYRVDLPNNAFAAGVSYSTIVVQATGVFPVCFRVSLTAYDPLAAGPTVSQFAQAVLKEDMSLITGEASRSMLNTFRTLRNKWTINGGVLTVYKEDDATPAFTAVLTSVAGADGITGMDPT